MIFTARTDIQMYPSYSMEIEEIRKNGISKKLLCEIIQKHLPNAEYNKELYRRYNTIEGGVPIFRRQPRFEEENPVNNKINNDFFSEIVDIKTGYFAGKPAAYAYSKTNEATEAAGGKDAAAVAQKTITDFTTRNNMYGVDMETTKLAGIYGYCGRLFYIDNETNERVMTVHGYETIILSQTNISEPEFAVRYYSNSDLYGSTVYTAEFYDNANIYIFKGSSFSDLKLTETRPHMFDYCPLQGVLNNPEALGDAEKVLSPIDDYDKVVSDCSNETEAFAHAYLIFEGMNIDDDTIRNGQKSGAFVFPHSGTQQGKAYFLTKNINDAFTEHHLKRLEDNIYRFSKTPNFNDQSFGSASGISLKFKLHGLETKCGSFQAQLMNSIQYMWKVLASAWKKKGIAVDPLQCTVEFKRNFPLDTESEARTVQALIASGIPKEVAFSQLSFVDDPGYIMDMIDAENNHLPSLDSDESSGQP